MDIGAIKAASQAAHDGVWVGEDIHGIPGVDFLVRPMTSPAVFRELGRRMRQAPESLRDGVGNLTADAEDAIDDAVMGERVLLDWRGLTNDGAPVEYAPELAREFLAYSVFWTAVRASMQHATSASRDAMEALAKNSDAPSGHA